KPRMKKHDFAYTGIVICGDCGGMITATERAKIIKSTGQIKIFTYYHCTKKKKGVPCKKQKPITLEELEQQIDLELEKSTIDPDFQQWAIDILNKKNDTEIADRTKIYEMRHNALSEAQKELDNLTKMRYRDLIDDEAFIKERDPLKDKIARLKNELRETEDRAEKWLELTEKTFHFATYARKAFMTGTLEQKREIFNALGSNFSLKDGKLSIVANEWFIPIQKAYPELVAEYNRLKLREYVSAEARNAAFAALFLRWGA
ncbi:MAG: recombinase zinc beta ribbon domain-containing protein, partial [Patescibacteria group bacterium]|nr:recombinase zinc beta ribbon domain-containing protein [Patescibacteria group bacterium]